MKHLTQWALIAMLYLNFLTFTGAIAQKQGQEKTDSLFSVIKTAKADTAKVNAFNALAIEFRNNNPDTAIYFANEALALATRLNYKMGIADAYLWKGTAITNLGKYEEALKNLNDALLSNDQILVSEKTVDKSKILKQRGRVYNNIGSINKLQGNYSEALKNYFAALKILEEMGDKKGIANACHSLGLFYYHKSEFPKSLEYYFKSLKVREEIRVEYSNDLWQEKFQAHHPNLPSSNPDLV